MSDETYRDGQPFFHYSTCHYVRYKSGGDERMGAPCNCEIRRQAEITDRRKAAAAEMIAMEERNSATLEEEIRERIDTLQSDYTLLPSTPSKHIAEYTRIAPPEYEEVDHPAHYGGDWLYEPIKVMEAWNRKFPLTMTINIMMAIKYLVRAGRKPGVSLEKDLCKAIWHIEREMKRERPLCLQQCPDQVESLKWK